MSAATVMGAAEIVARVRPADAIRAVERALRAMREGIVLPPASAGIAVEDLALRALLLEAAGA